jgi:iron complex outermembrane receptor protein
MPYRPGLSIICVIWLSAFPTILAAQPAPPQVALPTVTVTAQKEPADIRTLPMSVTAVAPDWLQNGRITWIADAALFAPNVVFTEFTARKLSNARFRGIGSSPANAAVTTYFDGVPMLHANASNLDFSGVAQLEFVRGPQSALFGRNALGGIINIASERPSLAEWRGDVTAPFGNFGAREIRGSVSGPVSDRFAIGVSGGHAEREGFTINTVTGNDLDSRSANFGKAQLLYAPSSRWETRLIVSGEGAEDGDYALADLDAVRATPFTVAHDFEGYTHRNVFNTTVLNRFEGGRLSITATTGFVRWDTDDQTDLDYTPQPLATRSNLEDASQFTQEVRVASAPGRALGLSPSANLKWQAGMLVFTQNYDQEAVNTLAPFTISEFVPFTVQQTTPRAALDDVGVGVYGQGTLTFKDDFDVTAGVRFDHESKDAHLETFYTPAIAPPGVIDADESYDNLSPQFATAYRFGASHMVYGSVARGFKAGGFNPASPPGEERYAEEHTWNVEGGIKAMWAGGRVLANAAVFWTDWSDLQLNLPNPQVPGQFYIANVGDASSRGVELELMARPASGLDVFATLGYTHARFGDNAARGGFDVSGLEIPFTPDYTLSFGAQLTQPINSQVSLYGRGEVLSYGAFHYDDLNLASQDAYGLVNLRGGMRGRYVFGELWIRNAFDTRYVPLALAYPGLAPSGFVGEPGRPRTFGVNVGVTF